MGVGVHGREAGNSLEGDLSLVESRKKLLLRQPAILLCLWTTLMMLEEWIHSLRFETGTYLRPPLTSYYLSLLVLRFDVLPSSILHLLSCALKYFVNMWRTHVHLCWMLMMKLQSTSTAQLIVRFVCTWNNVWSVIYDSSDLCLHSLSPRPVEIDKL